MEFPLFCETHKLRLPQASIDGGASSVTLKEYVFGRRVVLQSPHPKAKVTAQIDNAAGSFFSPFRRGVTGGVYFGRLYLAWNLPMITNGFRPILSGRLVETGRSTEVRASYGAPLIVLVFLAIWYSLFAFITVSTAAAVLREGLGTRDPWAMAAFPLMAIVPVAIHLIFHRNADAHWDAMLVMLKDEAGLVPVKTPRAR
jgi:hypothetical protein